MSRETFEARMEKRMKDLKQNDEHSIFRELQGELIEYDYDTKSLDMAFEATEFHKNGFGIMFGGSLVGMFDIAFGTLTAGLGDYDICADGTADGKFPERGCDRIPGDRSGGSSINRKDH